MTSNDRIYKAASPIYLLRSTEHCWKCHVKQEVVALAVMQIYSGDSELDKKVNADAKPFIVFYVEEMPQEILNYIYSVHPLFEKRMPKTTEFAYYMNTCKCGAHFGDYFLHLEPGGAFFPMSKDDAIKVSIGELSLTGTFDFVCEYSIGQGTFIFEHAQRK
jgi:hypothetical protein